MNDLENALEFSIEIPSDWSNTILSNIIFRTSNEHEHVHLLMIELEHLIFGFKRTNEHRT